MAMSSHQDKMLNLRCQLQENQADLQNFLKDLDSWESDIRSKDEQLKKQTPAEEQKLPPVRNSLNKKKKKKVKKKDGTGQVKPKRISSYDYRAWDKFDVDQACEAVGDVEVKSSESSDYETDEEWEEERRKQQAVMEKDKGNDYFKRGELDNAIECYTLGADLDPTNPLLPANRAMALLKQEKFAAAELDCTIALSLDPLYTKAYLRRGAARVGLKKWESAKVDYEKVLQLEPQNKKAKQEMEVIEKELSKESLVSRAEPDVSIDAGIVNPVVKTPLERSKKPLRRIHIEEIGGEEDEERKAAIARVQEGQSQLKKELTQKDNQMFERFTAISPADIAARGQGQDRSKGQASDLLDESEAYGASGDTSLSDRSGSKSNNASADFEVQESRVQNGQIQNGLKSLKSEVSDRLSSVQLDSEVSPSSAPFHPPPSKGQRSSADKGQTSPSTSPRELPVPTTSFQFQADYKVLKSNSEAFYKYFKKINPETYPKLFGQFLDSEVFLKVLRAFKDFFIPNNEDMFSHLQCLSNVKRFSMAVMFLSAKEKQVVKDLFQHLRGMDKYQTMELNDLAAKYDIR